MKWISFKDRLPERTTNILALSKHGFCAVVFFTYTIENKPVFIFIHPNEDVF